MGKTIKHIKMTKKEFILYLQKLERKRKRQKEGRYSPKYRDSLNDWVYVSRNGSVVFHNLNLDIRGKVTIETSADASTFSRDECDSMNNTEEITYNDFIKQQKELDEHYKTPEYIKQKNELELYRKTPEYKKYRKEERERRIMDEMFGF